MKGRSELTIALALGLSAFTIRLVMMVALRTYEFDTTREMGFEMGQLAASLASGSGYSLNGEPSAWMAPLFPALLWLVFETFGIYSTASAISIFTLQAVVSSLSAVAIYVLGKKMFSAKVGFAAGALWVIHFGAINYSIRRIWASSFTALGLVLIVLATLWVRDDRKSPERSVVLGLIIGITALFEPVVLVLVPFIILWLIFEAPNTSRFSISSLGLMFLTMVLVVVPWTIRNMTVFERPILIKSTFGTNLWQGNNPYVEEAGVGIRSLETLGPHISDQESAYLSQLNEVELSSYLGERAATFITENPLTFLTYTIQRAIMFWTIGFRESALPGGLLVSSALSAFLLVTLAFSGIGIVLSRNRWRVVSVIVLILAVYPIPYYITISDTYRYRFPLEPFILVMAGYAIVRFISIGSAYLANANCAKRVWQRAR